MKSSFVGIEEKGLTDERAGVYSSLTEHDMKQYVGSVLREIKVLQDIDEILKKGRDQRYPWFYL